jgi:hypothetical protein
MLLWLLVQQLILLPVAVAEFISDAVAVAVAVAANGRPSIAVAVTAAQCQCSVTW